jgi:hypothetical protein
VRKIIVGIAAVAVVSVIVSLNRANQPSPTVTATPSVAPAARPLDYTKPLFTEDGHKTIVCPRSIMQDPTKDPKEVWGLWVTMFNREAKVTAMGCQMWRPNMQVYAKEWTPYRGPNEPDSIVFLGLTPGDYSYFTLANDLRN